MVNAPARANSGTSPAHRAAAARQHKETVMNPVRAIRRLPSILAGLAVAFAAAGPAALASTSPGRTRLLSWADPPLPPGWNKHPPLPAHVHPLATGGIPGWQITLIVAGAVLLATALAVTPDRMRVTRLHVTASAA